MVFLLLLLLHVSTCKFLDKSLYANNVRATKALELIKSKTCMELISSENCTKIKDQLTHDMVFFVASTEINQKNLNIIKVKMTEHVEKRMKITKLDAVVVIDPLPEAHYGHPVVVFPIKIGISKHRCQHLHGVYYGEECMYLPDYKICQLSNKPKKPGEPRETCHFHSIPRVYDATDGENKLKCIPNIEGFGKCPLIKVEPINKCDNNNGVCMNTIKPPNTLCHKSCDYAVMLSGGWNKFMNKYRHYLNLKEMHHYFQRKEFKKKNIKIFFANNGTIELDKNVLTQDTIPATEARTVTKELEAVCKKRTSCIDTFVLYLNSPTLPNGNMLLWDKHNDGKAQDSEIISVTDLIKPFRSCNAKNILIIVDQNFAGHIIDEVKSQRAMGFDDMERVSVITASSKQSYSWRRDFTQKFIEFDSKIDAGSKRISSIYRHLKDKLSAEYKVKYLQGRDIDLTVTGEFGKKAGCQSNKGETDDGWSSKAGRKRRFINRQQKYMKNTLSHGT